MVLDPDGEIVTVSDAACADWQMASQCGLVGTSWFDLWPAPLRPELRRTVDRACCGALLNFVGQRVMADNTLKAWDITLQPIPESDGSTSEILVVCRSTRKAPTLPLPDSLPPTAGRQMPPHWLDHAAASTASTEQA